MNEKKGNSIEVEKWKIKKRERVVTRICGTSREW